MDINFRWQGCRIYYDNRSDHDWVLSLVYRQKYTERDVFEANIL